MFTLSFQITTSDVKFVQVSSHDAIKSMTGMGIPKWQAEGVCELWEMVNDGMNQSPSNDIERVLGRKAMGIEEFFALNCNLFKTV